MELADITGDGQVDAVVSWEEGHSITLFVHPPADAPATSPWRQVEVAHLETAGFEGVGTGDIDGDGRPDIIGAPNNPTVELSVYFNDPQRGWTAMELPDPGTRDRWLDVLIVDLDGDGDLDVVGQPATSRVIALFNPGPTRARDPSAWTCSTIALARHVMALHPVDVDEDGDLDLIVSQRRRGRGEDWRGSWWAEQGSDGGPRGTWTRHPIGPMDGAAAQISCWSEPRLAQPYRDPARLNVYTLADGAWTTGSIPLPRRLARRALKGCAWADVDADGDQDLMVTTRSGGAVVWIVDDRSGRWVWRQIDYPRWGSKADDPRACDPDGDGDIDVCITEEGRGPGARGAGWFENPAR